MRHVGDFRSRTLVQTSVPALPFQAAPANLRPGSARRHRDCPLQPFFRRHPGNPGVSEASTAGPRVRDVLRPDTVIGPLLYLHGVAGPLHQLVASGVAHPPPPRDLCSGPGGPGGPGVAGESGRDAGAGAPRAAGALHGRRGIYTAERNYLVLERRQGAWRAWWELEDSGGTPALPLLGMRRRRMESMPARRAPGFMVVPGNRIGNVRALAVLLMRGGSVARCTRNGRETRKAERPRMNTAEYGVLRPPAGQSISCSISV